MSRVTRRDFIKNSMLAVGAISGARVEFSQDTPPTKRSATDWVTLGRSGVKVTRLGIGTGTNSGQVQRELGQKEFTKLIRHAYDQGIRFFDTADNYDQMHEMLAKALEGIDRDTYVIQTKMKWHGEQDVMQTIDRFRTELRSDYFDSFLLHCTTRAQWPDELKRLMDDLDKAKEKEMVRGHGASCHGLKPLRAMPNCTSWLDVALLRVNHNGTHMDNEDDQWNQPGDRDTVIGQIEKIHAAGVGVIGMKIIGNGDFTDPEQRDASIQYVMGLDCVDAVVIGFKNTAEIDEAIARMNKHLNA